MELHPKIRKVRSGEAEIAYLVWGALDLQIRAGRSSGEDQLDASDVHGIAVDFGAWVASLAGSSEILVSSTAADLTVGSGLVVDGAGGHELNGEPDRWRLDRTIG